MPARTLPTLHPPSPPTVHQLSRLALLELINSTAQNASWMCQDEVVVVLKKGSSIINTDFVYPYTIYGFTYFDRQIADESMAQFRRYHDYQNEACGCDEVFQS